MPLSLSSFGRDELADFAEARRLAAEAEFGPAARLLRRHRKKVAQDPRLTLVLARAEIALGNDCTAMRLIETARRRAQTIGDKSSEADAVFTLGGAHLIAQRRASAIGAAKRAQLLYTRLNLWSRAQAAARLRAAAEMA
ncbi:MAG: hypothetical protein AAF401_17540 [Pseudomonadota bacterium]